MYGIIGKPLIHSFSPKYFNDLFGQLRLNEKYLAFPLQKISEFPNLLIEQPDLKGLNVTIPYKETIMPFLDELDEIAQAVNAVNCIKIKNGKLKGFNTDTIGFSITLKPLLKIQHHKNALILGTGGASKAIAFALKQMNIHYKFVSRTKKENNFSYADLSREVIQQHTLIINTTPLGTSPQTDLFPEIPYQFLTKEHLLYDLVYNPEQTKFLEKAITQGATIKNGHEMLIAQADASWEIWKKDEL